MESEVAEGSWFRDMESEVAEGNEGLGFRV
jgi:hypothetical protein